MWKHVNISARTEPETTTSMWLDIGEVPNFEANVRHTHTHPFYLTYISVQIPQNTIDLIQASILVVSCAAFLRLGDTYNFQKTSAEMREC